MEKLSNALKVEFHVLFLDETENMSNQNEQLPVNIKSYLLKLQDNNAKLLSALEKELLHFV